MDTQIEICNERISLNATNGVWKLPETKYARVLGYRAAQFVVDISDMAANNNVQVDFETALTSREDHFRLMASTTARTSSGTEFAVVPESNSVPLAALVRPVVKNSGTAQANIQIRVLMGLTR